MMRRTENCSKCILLLLCFELLCPPCIWKKLDFVLMHYFVYNTRLCILIKTILLNEFVSASVSSADWIECLCNLWRREFCWILYCSDFDVFSTSDGFYYIDLIAPGNMPATGIFNMKVLFLYFIMIKRRSILRDISEQFY